MGWRASEERCAPRARATWLSGMPRVNSKTWIGWRAAGEVEEGAFDFSAALGEVLLDDEEAGVRVGGEVLIAPEGAGGELGLSIGRSVVADFNCGFCGGRRLTFSPCVEKSALCWQEAVEAGE